MPSFERPTTRQVIENVFTGLTVSFVALSLGAAFGLLSGRGAFSGMISAGLIATITAILGGTRVQCSGPTGPMTAVTAVIVATAHDRFQAGLSGVSADHAINITLILMAGILLIFSLLRLGKYIAFVPNVVVSGFMNGIALIIWVDQFEKLFGWNGAVAFTGARVENVALFCVSVVLVFSLPRVTRSILPKFESLLSSTILTLILATAAAYFMGLDVERVHLSSSLRGVSDLTDLVAAQWPTTWNAEVLRFAFPFALQLAFLAYLDTLLTSLVVDKMTGETTRPNKELAAQGVAGGIVALVGGIPGAQATIRSVLIIKERGTLRLAGVLVGVFALIEMILFQDAINLIPKAVFAGILVKVGYDVFDWIPVRLYLKELFRRPSVALHEFFSRHDDEPVFVTNREILIVIGTTLVTVIWDLNAAVGIFTALFYLHNRVLNRNNPMRDLRPPDESESFATED